MASENLPVQEIWAKTVDVVKHRVNNRSLWETLEHTFAITAEDGIFVLEVDPRFTNQTGHLNTSDHRNAIEQSLTQLGGKPFRFRVIDGTTLEDWETTKRNDARIEAMRTATYEKRDRKEAESHTWDGVLEYVSRAYAAMPMRQLPQTKARYLTEMLYVLSDAINQLHGEDADETTQRSLGRAIDKVAGAADVPSTMVALELERLRAWQKQSGQA